MLLVVAAPVRLSYVPDTLFVRGNATATAANIAAHETLFRFSIVGDLLIYTGLIVLIWALYVVLRPVNRNLALLAVLFQLAENAVLRAGTVNAMIALRLLKRGDYLKGFEPVQLERPEHAGAHDERGLHSPWPGFDCLCLSLPEISLHPQGSGGTGIFASLFLALVTLIFIVWPGLGALLGLGYLAPMFFYEVGLWLWLIFKGLKVR